jgi:hypothetical protein
VVDPLSARYDRGDIWGCDSGVWVGAFDVMMNMYHSSAHVDGHLNGSIGAVAYVRSIIGSWSTMK